MKENNKNSTRNPDEFKESVWTKCVTNEGISLLEKCYFSCLKNYTQGRYKEQQL